MVSTPTDPGPVVLVLPCFNEELRLEPGAILEHLAARPWLEVLAVDDGSTDGTAGVLDGLAAAMPGRISVLGLERNCGKGEAVRQGLLQALAGRGSRPVALVGFWDADLAIPLQELDAMAEVLMRRPELLAVLGSRRTLLADPRTRRRMRRLLGRLASALVHWSLPLPIIDTQCGAKLLRASDQVLACLQQPFLSRWLFDLELLLRLEREWGALGSGLVVEHSIAACRDVHSSKVGLLDYLRGVVELARIRRLYRVGPRV